MSGSRRPAALALASHRPRATSDHARRAHGVNCLITTAMAVVVAAERERVWRALSDPREIVRWDETRLALVDRHLDYPKSGERVRWRTKLGGVQLVLSETPSTVEPPEGLTLACRAGSLRYEQHIVLAAERADRAQPARTRVSLKLSAGNRLQLIGADLDRFEIRRLLIERIDVTLRSLQKWCENDSPARPHAPL